MSKVIIFPTDTVYGIGCPIFDVEGIKKIYEVKHRSFDKPLACLCSSLEQIKMIAKVDETTQKIIQKLMPGALTLILKSQPIVEKKIGYKTIGVRIPNSALAKRLLDENGPMLTTSVNESGEKPLNTYEEIVAQFGSVVQEIYQSEEESSNVSSTVVDLTKDEIKVLREGTITLTQIKNAIRD